MKTPPLPTWAPPSSALANTRQSETHHTRGPTDPRRSSTSLVHGAIENVQESDDCVSQYHTVASLEQILPPSSDPEKLQLTISSLRVALKQANLQVDDLRQQVSGLTDSLQDKHAENSSLQQRCTQVTHDLQLLLSSLQGTMDTTKDGIVTSLHAQLSALNQRCVLLESDLQALQFQLHTTSSTAAASVAAEQEERTRLASEMGQLRLLLAARQRHLNMLQGQVEQGREDMKQLQCHLAEQAEERDTQFQRMREECDEAVVRAVSAEEAVTGLQQQLGQVQQVCESQQQQIQEYEVKINELQVQREWLEAAVSDLRSTGSDTATGTDIIQLHQALRESQAAQAAAEEAAKKAQEAAGQAQNTAQEAVRKAEEAAQQWQARALEAEHALEVTIQQLGQQQGLQGMSQVGYHTQQQQQLEQQCMMWQQRAQELEAELQHLHQHLQHQQQVAGYQAVAVPYHVHGHQQQQQVLALQAELQHWQQRAVHAESAHSQLLQAASHSYTHTSPQQHVVTQGDSAVSEHRQSGSGDAGAATCCQQSEAGSRTRSSAASPAAQGPEVAVLTQQSWASVFGDSDEDEDDQQQQQQSSVRYDMGQQEEVSTSHGNTSNSTTFHDDVCSESAPPHKVQCDAGGSQADMPPWSDPDTVQLQQQLHAAVLELQACQADLAAAIHEKQQLQDKLASATKECVPMSAVSSALSQARALSRQKMDAALAAAAGHWAEKLKAAQEAAAAAQAQAVALGQQVQQGAEKAAQERQELEARCQGLLDEMAVLAAQHAQQLQQVKMEYEAEASAAQQAAAALDQQEVRTHVQQLAAADAAMIQLQRQVQQLKEEVRLKQQQMDELQQALVPRVFMDVSCQTDLSSSREAPMQVCDAQPCTCVGVQVHADMTDSWSQTYSQVKYTVASQTYNNCINIACSTVQTDQDMMMTAVTQDHAATQTVASSQVHMQTQTVKPPPDMVHCEVQTVSLPRPKCMDTAVQTVGSPPINTPGPGIPEHSAPLPLDVGHDVSSTLHRVMQSESSAHEASYDQDADGSPVCLQHVTSFAALKPPSAISLAQHAHHDTTASDRLKQLKKLRASLQASIQSITAPDQARQAGAVLRHSLQGPLPVRHTAVHAAGDLQLCSSASAPSPQGLTGVTALIAQHSVDKGVDQITGSAGQGDGAQVSTCDAPGDADGRQPGAHFILYPPPIIQQQEPHQTTHPQDLFDSEDASQGGDMAADIGLSSHRWMRAPQQQQRKPRTRTYPSMKHVGIHTDADIDTHLYMRHDGHMPAVGVHTQQSQPSSKHRRASYSPRRLHTSDMTAGVVSRRSSWDSGADLHTSRSQDSGHDEHVAVEGAPQGQGQAHGQGGLPPARQHSLHSSSNDMTGTHDMRNMQNSSSASHPQRPSYGDDIPSPGMIRRPAVPAHQHQRAGPRAHREEPASDVDSDDVMDIARDMLSALRSSKLHKERSAAQEAAAAAMTRAQQQVQVIPGLTVPGLDNKVSAGSSPSRPVLPSHSTRAQVVEGHGLGDSYPQISDVADYADVAWHGAQGLQSSTGYRQQHDHSQLRASVFAVSQEVLDESAESVALMAHGSIRTTPGAVRTTGRRGAAMHASLLEPFTAQEVPLHSVQDRSTVHAVRSKEPHVGYGHTARAGGPRASSKDMTRQSLGVASSGRCDVDVAATDQDMALQGVTGYAAGRSKSSKRSTHHHRQQSSSGMCVGQARCPSEQCPVGAPGHASMHTEQSYDLPQAPSQESVPSFYSHHVPPSTATTVISLASLRSSVEGAKLFAAKHRVANNRYRKD